MNIYALKGHKVIVTEKSIKTGLDKHKDRQAAFLTIGKIYTVERTEPLNSRTRVYLQEIPGHRFNSVAFEDVEPQSPEKDKLHPEYIRLSRHWFL
jgi:hypothetical protein